MGRQFCAAVTVDSALHSTVIEGDPINTVLGLALVFFLIAANAFFVAAEFALVAVDRSRLAGDAESGDRRARLIQSLVRRTSFHLSGAQLGITISSLVLGFVAEPAVAEVIEPGIERVIGMSGSRGLSIGLALAIATSVQLVLGELVPKNVAIARPTPTMRQVARPMHVYGVVAGPFVRLLNGAANRIVRRLGTEPTEEIRAGRSLTELEFVIRSSGEEGTLESSEVTLLTRSIRFREKTADDAMTPRVDVVSVDRTATLAELARLSIETGHSRFPVVGSSLDELVGIVHVKAIYDLPLGARGTTTVGEVMTEVFAVPESAGLESILLDMRRTGNHLAAVVDEHGGTAGIITLEDLLEEIVGEIDDEYDEVAELTVEEAPGSFLLAAALHHDEVAEACGFEMPEGDFETLAGFVLDQLQRIPDVGDRFSYGGWTLEVVEMDGRRIAQVRVSGSPTRARVDS